MVNIPKLYRAFYTCKLKLTNYRPTLYYTVNKPELNRVFYTCNIKKLNKIHSILILNYTCN